MLYTQIHVCTPTFTDGAANQDGDLKRQLLLEALLVGEAESIDSDWSSKL